MQRDQRMHNNCYRCVPNDPLRSSVGMHLSSSDVLIVLAKGDSHAVMHTRCTSRSVLSWIICENISGGMGTKVQYESYLSGYSVRDLNEDANSSWSRYCENKTFGGHFFNGFILRPENGYPEYGKEMLKRTMLEHEAIFRKQVYELHRLYSIQKELMDEFHQKELYRYSLVADTSQSNSFSSQMPPEGNKTVRQVPQLSVPSSGHNLTHSTVTNDLRPLLNLFKESSAQSSCSPIGKGPHLTDGNVQEPRLEKIPRKMLDLQLPAELYIDREDADRKEKEIITPVSVRYTVPSDKLYSAGPQNDVNLTLATCKGFSCLEDSRKSDLHKQNGFQTYKIADLNKPVGELQHERGFSSPHFFWPRARPEENNIHHFPLRPNTNFPAQQDSHFGDGHSVEGCFSSLPFTNMGEIRWQRPLYNNEAGTSRSSVNLFCSGLRNEKLPVSSEPNQLKSTQSHEVLLPNIDAWLRQKPNPGIEVYGRNAHLTVSNNPGPVASGAPYPFFVSNNMECSFSASPKPMNSICHITQTFPCFTESPKINMQNKGSHTATQDFSYANGISQQNSDLRPCMIAGSEASLCPDGFHRPLQPGTNSTCFGKLNLNSRYDSDFGNFELHGPQKRLKALQHINWMPKIESVNQELPKGIQDGFTTQQDTGIKATKRKFHTSSGEISWLTSNLGRNKSVDFNISTSKLDLDFSQGHIQMTSKASVVDSVLKQKHEEEKGPTKCYFQDFPSKSHVKNRMQSIGAYDSFKVTKILGVPIFSKPQQNPICSPLHQDQSVSYGINDHVEVASSQVELSPVDNASSLEKQTPERNLVRTKSIGPQSNINLNSIFVSEPCSTELPPEGEVEVPSSPTDPSVAAKVDPEIDVEAPVASQMEGNVLPHEEFSSSKKTDGFLQLETFHETLDKAAETIVLISLNQSSSPDDKCHQLQPIPFDSLHWFAEVVSSTTQNTWPSRSGGDYSNCLDDDLDDFELMTLKLEEHKPDEYWSRLREPVIQTQEEKCIASLLLRPRRGQARRRRDFQKDILPGLSSLSRLEVTEDLQTIGGLMKSSGTSLQTGLTRWSMDQNGFHFPTRGRRRVRSLAVTVSEINACPQKQPSHAEPEIDSMAMIGWGRTTRRGRRQRCLPATVTATQT